MIHQTPVNYDDLSISFEFFPPRSADAAAQLWGDMEKFESLTPKFASVTYGAGGSTRDCTFETAARIGRETSIAPAAHLTCVGASREEVDAVAQDFWDAGIFHIVALRGDGDQETGAYEPYPGGYAYAADLVAGLKDVADFEISVAAYPEAHPESSNWIQDIENLKRKVDAGADRAITQFFFDPELFLRYLERVRVAGIDIPIVPGILPITNFERTCSFAKRCGATVPDWLAALFEGLDEDPATRNLVAAVAAAEHCRQLQAAGIREFHFYTLNRADLTTAICKILRNPVLRDVPGELLTVKARGTA